MEIIKTLKKESDRQIYLATYNGQKVVLKCPLTDNEFAISKALQGSIYTEQLLDVYNEKCGIFDFIIGYQLSTYCANEQRSLSPIASPIFVRSLLNAITDIHNRNVVHADIHSENIMILPENSEIKVKIVDFGSSRFIDDDSDLLYMPKFIPPESFDFDNVELKSIWKPDIYADLYNVGLILNEIFNGVPNKYIPESFAYDESVKTKEIFASEIIFDEGVPVWVQKVTKTLLSNNPVERLDYKLYYQR